MPDLVGPTAVSECKARSNFGLLPSCQYNSPVAERHPGNPAPDWRLEREVPNIMPDDEQASRVVPPLASLEQEIPRSSILLDIWQMQQAMEARSVTAERQRNEILVELRGVQREMTDMRSEIALNKAFRLQFEAWLKVLKLIILGFAALGAYVVSQSSQLTKWWK